MPPQPVQLPPQKIIEKAGVRILCIADVRGNLRSLNELAKKANADYVLHTGDFGFYDDSSLERIADKTLRHVAQYSPLLEDSLKKRIQTPGPGSQSIKQLFAQVEHPLSELPLFLNKKYILDVPVYTVWGACEDVRVLEKFRSGEYKINNLHIIDEANSRLLDVGGVKLRLLGLGGAVVMHKLFDNGEGRTTIPGGQGTMWTTLLQMGELVDTAHRVYDPTETRIFVTHASPAREGLLNQLSVTLKADFSISAGLHFRYGSSYNEFSVNPTLDHYRGKLASSKASFNDVWETVKGEVLPAVQQNEAQNALLNNALDIVDKMPTSANGGNPFGGPASNTAPGAGQVDESAFKNMWNFNLADAAFGWLVLEVEGGRIGTEMRAQGFNFAHRGGKGVSVVQQQQQQQQQQQSSVAPATSSVTSAPTSNVGAVNVNVPSGPSGASSTTPQNGPAVPFPPSGPRNQQQPRATPPQPKPTAAPTGPKQPTPPPVQVEPPAAPKPATPRPVPSGPANRVATPVVTPLPTPAVEKPSTSNGTRTESPAPPPAVPKIDTPATTPATAPTGPQHQEASSPRERPKQFGLYINGVSSADAVRALFSSEAQGRIQRVDIKHPRNRPESTYFLAYFESAELAKETLDQLPEDLKVRHGLYENKPWVKLMDDYNSFSNSRPGMSDSKWGRGTGTGGGNTSESDNNMGGGYRRGYRSIRGARGTHSSDRGGQRGRGGGSKRGRDFDGGDGGLQHQTTD
ncbi:hypothetical protein L873DRAFT_1810978 [Choiromyces venosus 120613-1]|uniref:DUF2433 domain-containing protein n=1 Tax=Choiromyces venosus 120613-1 TaxID=1336337 RepID=A0A3N4JIT9_9PEZI|nr:hypothetical protein L873DRAFT_1810978 [Choiromyces venosus 120613-1]